MFKDDEIQDYYDQAFTGITYHEELAFKTFDECAFIDCNFSDAIFQSCKFKHCYFVNCNLSLLRLKGSYFIDVSFESCKILGVNWTYAEISLHQNLKFLKCNISQSNFLGLRLSSIIISECIARDVDFRDCDLSKAILTSNDFQNTLFSNTNLIKADFTNSTNYCINVFENQIKDAKFSLPEAISLLTGLGVKIS
jgi:fluoroquinolone resistance protein